MSGIDQSMIEELRQSRPESSELQLSSEAMELAVQQLLEALPDETEAGETFSLDEAMLYIRNHMRPG